MSLFDHVTACACEQSLLLVHTITKERIVVTQAGIAQIVNVWTHCGKTTA